MQRSDDDFQTDKVVLISGGHFIHDVYSSFLSPFLPLLIPKFGLTMLLAGTLTVIFRLPSLFNPIIGIISDRIELGVLAVVAPAITAIAMSLLGLAPNYAILCIMLLTAGLSAAVFHVLGPPMIAKLSGTRLGRGMSFWMTGGELARTIGPLFAVWAVTNLSLEGSYPVMIVGIFASLFLLIRLKGFNTRVMHRSEQGLKEVWGVMRKVMIPLSGIIISRAFLVGTLAAYLPTYIVSSGKSLWLGGISLAVLELAGTVGTLIGGTLSDRVGRRAVLFMTMPVSSLLMLAILYSPDWMLLPLLVLLGLAVFAFAPVIMAVVHDHCGKNRGAANGLYMTITFLSSAAVVVFVGWLSDLLGINMAFTISALFGLAGVPIIMFLPKSL
ncbi:MAG: MFS transporter [Deltaproteobacteria bacterium]|nr:MFS transporter [Deltaproteobacteria bacterium]